MSQKFKTKIRDLPVSSLPRSAWLSLFLIGLITLLGMSAANFYNHRTETQALATVADKLTKEIRDNINSYQYGLLGLRGAVLTAGLDNMTRQQYFTYFDSRDMFKEFPGIRGMGVLRKVPSDKLKQFADLMQKKGQPPFVFRSIGTSHGDRYLVEFFEPKEIGDTILGLDLGSEANRRQAADVAGRTGSAALSAPIQLIVDKSKVESFLLMLPIYAGAQHIINEQEREQHVQGWSYATLSIRDVLRNVQHEQKGVQLKIEDVTDSTTSVLFNPPLPQVLLLSPGWRRSERSISMAETGATAIRRCRLYCLAQTDSAMAYRWFWRPSHAGLANLSHAALS
jgi:CHASE1-domain containing sensor protein